MIQVKRIYDQSRRENGYRILVDRLWPRGVSKDKANVDLWLREIAPSDKLRKWFSHDPEKWKEFQSKYKKELEDKSELLLRIKQLEGEKKVITLLFSARDEKHNNAIVINEMLK